MENWLDHQPQRVVISPADSQLLVIYCLSLTTCTLGQDAPSAGLQTTPTGEVYGPHIQGTLTAWENVLTETCSGSIKQMTVPSAGLD